MRWISPFLLALVLFFCASSPRVSYAAAPNEGAAYDYCMSNLLPAQGTEAAANYYCGMNTNEPAVPHASNQCPVGRFETGAFYGVYPNGRDTSGYGVQGIVTWCVPASCPSGGDGGSGWYNPQLSHPDTVSDGCCVTFDMTGSDDFGGHKTVYGDYKETGSYCYNDYGASNLPTSGNSNNAPPQLCDSANVSCYDPKNHTACYGTESGEQVCTRLDDKQTGGCAVGATGAVCVGGKDGTPPPPPSDPPISSGQPPNDTNTLTQTTTDASGNSTTTTQNVDGYSGTSPGSGTPPSSGAGSGTVGGSGSNNNGSGNSGQKGTDDTGKCANGKVPTASGCSGTYRDDGCDTPPACFGDAVLCGVAANTHSDACSLQKLTSTDVNGALDAAGVPADGGASGDPSASGLVSSSDIGQSGFDAGGLGFSRTCPANPAFEVLGHSYELDLTPFCNFAGMLGWFVLLIAYLVGLRIVATGRS